MAPETPEEYIVWHGLGLTYLFYFLGGLYLTGPVIGWLLGLLTFYRWLGNAPGGRMSWPIGVWLIGMAVMLICVWVGHLQQHLGMAQLIKSSIGWAKGWALMALFIAAGAMLQVRAELLARSAMRVCLHTLILLPVFILAWVLRLPETAYVSPTRAIGGPGPEFFAVSLYEIDPQSGWPRWRLFTPWAPALGFVANIFFLLALVERSQRWRWIGIVASVLMILMSQSRLALLALVFNLGLLFAYRYLIGVQLVFMAAAFSALFAFVGAWLIDAATESYEAIKAARAASTRVREALARIAIHRWQTEAPVWGHGVVERGPHLVEYMPIGSHHSWYGLLFVKGAVGFMALAVPLLCSLFILFRRSFAGGACRMGFLACLLLFFYTFGENLEILAYLIWPGLFLIGIAHRSEAMPQKTP